MSRWYRIDDLGEYPLSVHNLFTSTEKNKLDGIQVRKPGDEWMRLTPDQAAELAVALGHDSVIAIGEKR